MTLEYAEIEYLYYPPSGEETSRAGVIPYTYVNLPDSDEMEELWLLGTLPSGRFSDFGGGCLITKGETPYECILREVDEESNGLLTDEIRDTLDLAFDQGIERDEPVDTIHVWRWVNQRRTEDVSYLVFIYVDYNNLADIGERFEGNEENTSIGWYGRDEILDLPVTEFNTSIQKFMRRFKINK